MALISLLNNQDNFLTSEMDVLADLIDENIQATGLDLRYMPKDQINLDEVFGEATISNFKEGFVIEMYLAAISNFNGDADLYSKFGMSHTDDATLIVSIRRFAAEGRHFGLSQPIEGDLIHMPTSNTMWTIKKVKKDPDYMQFGTNRVWRLECNLYTPSHESFVDDSLEPEDIGQTAQATDESGLDQLLGIAPGSKQDQSEFFNTRTVEETIPTEFNTDNPFGE